MNRSALDAFIAAFDALDVRSADIRKVDMVDRIDHIVVLGVGSYAELADAAAALHLPRPEHRVEGGYAWAESVNYVERGVSLAIQAHKPGKHDAA